MTIIKFADNKYMDEIFPLVLACEEALRNDYDYDTLEAFYSYMTCETFFITKN